MKVIDLHAAEPGMHLAKAVYTNKGALLLPAGRPLTARAIESFAQAGITQLFIDHSGNTTLPPSSLAVNVPASDQPTLREAPPLLHGQTKAQEAVPQESKASVTATVGNGEGVTEIAHRIISQRFHGLPLDNPHLQVAYELAVEQERRRLLSRPSKANGDGTQHPPAFQPPKPQPVKMESLIGESTRIGTLPIIFHRLVEIINDPYTSTADAAKVIATDPALSAKLLRLVNSAFYGLPNRIDTISHAVTLIGTGQLVMLAMGATLVTTFKGMPISLVNMKSFWSHSIACGVVARLLAQKHCPAESASFFIAGLLHDIGRLLIYSQLPTHSLYILTEAKRQKRPAHLLEEDTLGFNHYDLGHALLSQWRCSEELTLRVKNHHERITTDTALTDTIIPMADFLSQAFGYSISNNAIPPCISSDAWHILEVTPSDLNDIVLTMDEQVLTLRSLLTAD